MRRNVLVVASLGILAGSCALSGGGPIDHPRSSHEVVLRVERSGVGPMHPEEVIVPRSPWFSLLGDGWVIVEEPDQMSEFVTAYTVLRLSEEGIQLLLREARAAGLEGEHRELDASGGTDLDPGTHVIVVAGGSRHVTSAWSLEAIGELYEEGLDGETLQGREDLREFLSKLVDLAAWLGEDVVSGPEPYEATQWAVVWAVARDPVEDGPWNEEMLEDFRVREWPLERLAQWGDPHDQRKGLRCALVEGRALEELRRHIEEEMLWESDGVTYWVYARPLVPDETDCWAAHA